MKILIIEDNIKTLTFLQGGLEESYFTVDSALDGEEGLFLAQENPYDIIILDVMLPKRDGWFLVKKIRAINSEVYILLLTARDHVDDRVKGLELGADDYLVKPFAFSELLARIRSLLRRKEPRVEDILQVADLRVDIQKYKAFRANKRLHLTAKEYILLLLFVQRAGEVLTRSYIAEQVWDIHFDTDTNAIDVAVKRLRDKVDTEWAIKLIHTVRGIGYVLEQR